MQVKPDADSVSMPAADPPAHIVHIAKHCGYGNGNVHVAVDLACVQAQAGLKVSFVSAGGTFVDLLEQHGVHHLTMLQEPRKPIEMVRSAYRLMRFCRRERPSVLHAHMTTGAVLGFLASKMSGVPLVTTVHNSFDPQSIAMRLGRRVVAVSNAERDHLIRQGYPPGKVTTVLNAPNNSPREAFMTNDREIKLSHPCVAMICALHRRKGVFDVIEAFTSLAAEFPLWKLYIAGEGPDRESLEAQAVACGMAERIIFLGFVPAPKVLFRELDIFVLASYADPGSLSIGEARSAGCAIIATGVGGTPEMLDHGNAGRIVPPGSPAKIAANLRVLMENPQEREVLRASALKGSETFDVALLVNRYAIVYNEARGILVVPTSSTGC